MKYYKHGSCECRLPSVSTDTSQWICSETQPWRRSYATAWELELPQTRVLEVHIPWRAVWSNHYSRNAHLFTEGRLQYLEPRAAHVLIIWYFPPSDVTRFRAHAVYFRLCFQQVVAVEGASTRISIHSACRCVLILSRVLTMVQYVICGIVCSMNSLSRPVLKNNKKETSETLRSGDRIGPVPQAKLTVGNHSVNASLCVYYSFCSMEYWITTKNSF